MICADRNATFTFPFNGKRDTPGPTGTARFLTVKQSAAAERQYLSSKNLADPDKRFAGINAAIAVGLVGWSGLTDPDGKEIPYAGNMDDLAGALSEQELCDLFEHMLFFQRLTEQDRKNSGSASASTSATTATTAPAASA